MSRPRASGTSPSRKKRSATTANTASRRAAKRARDLIELMLAEMLTALKKPDHFSDEAWERLFGAKQSMVANLQKLVSALAALPDADVPTQERAPETAETISPEEMKMLRDWLAEEGGS